MIMSRFFPLMTGIAFHLAALLAARSASAMTIDWSGTYRIEGIDVLSTTLSDNPGAGKMYILNGLILNPKIIAMDGVNIVSSIAVLGNPKYPGSQTGQPFGLGNSTPGSATPNVPNVVSRNQGPSSPEVRQLYLNVNHEYGSLLVGRAPVQFGLGITYNAGAGAFDHWGDVHDLLAYKFLIGNLSLMPIIGKPYSYAISPGRDIVDVMLQIEYNNPETESLIGLMFSQRTASLAANDGDYFIKGVDGSTPGPSKTGGWNGKSYNLEIGRGWESFKFKFEAGFQDTSTGLTPAGSSDEIKANGYGLAVEMNFPRSDSKWEWSVKTGVASGDNPSTANFEGFGFHRNYDVAFLMFNHPMGQYDLFRSSFQRQMKTGCTAPATSACYYPNEESLDEETIANAFYFAPTVNYQFSDHWSWRNTFATAQLQTNPSATDSVARDVGYEWDTALIYKPHERIQWVNEVGFFLPGGAFKNGSANFDTKFNYGIQSKASISF
ncbi:MAG: hypothetical protein C5B49_02090 [Bdellovibrio sp.]|nr:MAG: hypothetical protein C5B49_02090 [Bdellovibrio sp.]